MSTKTKARKTTKTQATARMVTLVVHNTGSEGVDVVVFEGTAEERKAKALAEVAERLGSYVEERSRMSDEDNDEVHNLLAEGKVEEALEAWSTAQDEGDEVDFFDQESLEIREQEVR